MFKPAEKFCNVHLFWIFIKIRKPKRIRARKILRSLERLIDKELLIGFGKRTSHKWFITEVKLTAKGLKIAKKLLGEQMRLKF